MPDEIGSAEQQLYEALLKESQEAAAQAQPEPEAPEPSDPDPADEPEGDDLPAASSASGIDVGRMDSIERRLEMLAQMFEQNNQRQPDPRSYERQDRQPTRQEQEQQDYLMTHQAFQQQLAPFAQEIEKTRHIQWQIIQNQELVSQQQAAAAIRAANPDFDQVVPEQLRKQALETDLKSGRYGIDWYGRMKAAYDVASAQTKDKEIKELRAQLDELSARREQRNKSVTKAAAQVPASGAPYQKPAAQSNPYERGYRGATEGFLAELRNS